MSFEDEDIELLTRTLQDLKVALRDIEDFERYRETRRKIRQYEARNQ